jgi:hypothetical protein
VPGPKTVLQGFNASNAIIDGCYHQPDSAGVRNSQWDCGCAGGVCSNRHACSGRQAGKLAGVKTDEQQRQGYEQKQRGRADSGSDAYQHSRSIGHALNRLQQCCLCAPGLRCSCGLTPQYASCAAWAGYLHHSIVIGLCNSSAWPGPQASCCAVLWLCLLT